MFPGRLVLDKSRCLRKMGWVDWYPCFSNPSIPGSWLRVEAVHMDHWSHMLTWPPVATFPPPPIVPHMALYHCSLLRKLGVLNLGLQASHTLLISSTCLLLCPLLTPFLSQSHYKQGLTHLGGLLLSRLFLLGSHAHPISSFCPPLHVHLGRILIQVFPCSPRNVNKFYTKHSSLFRASVLLFVNRF